MSLPTYAKFYHKDGTLAGDCFVNAGWHITPDSIEQVIFKEFPRQVYSDDRIDYFTLYNMMFSLEFINDIIDLSRDERVQMLKLFMNKKENYGNS